MVRAVTPIPFVKARFFDRCGKPLTGGQVYTYEANTTTPKVTYKDPYGLTPNTNPIILDAAGEADIYLDGTYRIRITDRNDVLVNDVAKIGSWFSDNLQDTLDNISGAMDDALKPVLQNLDDAINIAAAAGAGANGWDANLVAYGETTQKQVNDGLESIATMLAIKNPRNGQRVYVKSYHAGLNKGGGMFVYDSTKAGENNSATIFNGWVRQFETLTVFDAGAKGDGVFDDRPAFQVAIDYLHSRGGGELYIPKPPVGYRWKSYDTTESACLVIRKPLRGIYADPISLRGETLLTDIKVDLGVGVTIDAAIKLKGGGLYKKFENLSVWGGINSTTPNCTRVLDGFDTWYPNLTIRDCRFYVAVEDCVRLATYISVFDKSQTAYSKIGICIQAPGGIDAPCTALTFNSPYGLNHTHNAIWLGQTTYSTINSPAADHIINTTDDGYEAYPYHINIARGVTINGLGAESSTRILYVKTAQGLTLNGIMTLSIGNAETPPEALIRIDGGASTVISGIWNHGAKGFNKMLKLGKVFSAESVTILDQSIEPSQVSYESNWRFDKPVRFLLWDTSRKDVVVNLPATGTDADKSAALINSLNEIRYYTSLENTVTVNFPPGDYPLISAFGIPHANLKGSGKIVFNGHSTGSRIVLKTAGAIQFLVPTKLPIIFKNIEIYAENTVPTNIKPLGIAADCDITFDNSRVTAENTWRDVAISAGKINLINGSYIALKNYYAHDALYTTQKLDAAPTLGKYPIGYRVYASNPDATRVGWVNTVRDGANWVTF